VSNLYIIYITLITSLCKKIVVPQTLLYCACDIQIILSNAQIILEVYFVSILNSSKNNVAITLLYCACDIQIILSNAQIILEVYFVSILSPSKNNVSIKIII
jgi:hypothetical protein